MMTVTALELKKLCIAKDKRIAELESAIRDSLYGSLLDKQGNRDDNGLANIFNRSEYYVDRAKNILSEALEKEPDA